VPGQGRGIYLQHKHAPSRNDIKVIIIAMPATAADYAATLYDKLHQADAHTLDWIAVDCPPNTADWEAVQDRLTRASSSGIG
jgi:L-threonylcarbamoyladenylate synthase